jgi:alanine racemase
VIAVPVRAQARINLAAIERNVARLRAALAPNTAMGAVVKANAYGHGAVPVARMAQAAGADWLAVATAGEAAELRAAGIEGPLLVMGAVSGEELPTALGAGADLVAWTEEVVEEVVRAAGGGPSVGIHVKLDTGMGRLGTREPERALALAERVSNAQPRVTLRGAMTHFATAAEDPDFVAEQLDRFRPFVESVRARWPQVLIHAANSGAVLSAPDSHFDLVRCGIAVYGCDPAGSDPQDWELEPALELSSYVAAVKPAHPGDSVGYGRRFIAERDTWIATVPIGYGDGILRALGGNCDVLIRGRRYPVVGTMSMDNITVEVPGPDAVAVGDQVTLIGRDGAERQTAEELARRAGTINYEVVCAISARVPRVYHRDGSAVEH